MFSQQFCRPVSELTSDRIFAFPYSNQLILYVGVRYGKEMHCLNLKENKYHLTSFYDVINIFQESTNFGQNRLMLAVSLWCIAKAQKKSCIKLYISFLCLKWGFCPIVALFKIFDALTSFCDVINGLITQFLAIFSKSEPVTNIRFPNKTTLCYYIENLCKTH